MEESLFLELFITEVSPSPRYKLTLDSKLAELDFWDSLAVVATIALIDNNCKCLPSVETILKCKTIRELYLLTKEKNEAP